MSTSIKLRRDILSNWELENPILALGEVGLVLDINQITIDMKVGNGVDSFTALPTFIPSASVTATASALAELTPLLDTKVDNTRVLTDVPLGAKFTDTTYSAYEMLTSIKTVDGVGSGLDADLLDGQSSSYYYPASNPNGYTNDMTPAEILTALRTVDGVGSGLDADLLGGQSSASYYPASNPNGYTNDMTPTEILTAIKIVDGVGSGLDAALLEGREPDAVATPNTIALRDISGDISMRLPRSTYPVQVTAPISTAELVFRNSELDNYHRTMTKTVAQSWLGVASGSLSDAGHSFASNGYQKLSNGLIIQWGQTLANIGTHTFALAFPTSCIQLIMHRQYNVDAAAWASEEYISSLTNTGFAILRPQTSTFFKFIAIGY